MEDEDNEINLIDMKCPLRFNQSVLQRIVKHPSHYTYYTAEENGIEFKGFGELCMLLLGADKKIAYLSRTFHISFGYVLCIILALGFVGNIFNFITFYRSQFSKAYAYMYFRCLSLSDLVAVVLLFFSVVLRYGWNIRYLSYGEAFYYAHIYRPLSNIMFGVSGLLLVAITVDRYVVICHILKFKSWKSKSRAKYIVAACCCLPVVLNVPTAFRMVVEEVVIPITLYRNNQTNTENIYFVKESSLMDNQAYINYCWFIYVYYAITDHILIIILTALSINGYRKHTTHFSKIDKRPGDNSKVNGQLSFVRTITNGMSMETRKVSDKVNVKLSRSESTVSADSRRLVKFMLLIATTHLIFVTPILVTGILLPLLPSSPDTDIVGALLTTTSTVLFACNISFNFYIYFIGSKFFRLQFFGAMSKLFRILK